VHCWRLDSNNIVSNLNRVVTKFHNPSRDYEDYSNKRIPLGKIFQPFLMMIVDAKMVGFSLIRQTLRTTTKSHFTLHDTSFMLTSIAEKAC